jgi:dTDP-4-amino-4,6-dideoxygalactose transaminase
MTGRGAAAEAPPVPLLDLTAQFEGLRSEIEGALARVVTSQAFILGPEVEAFEAAIAEYLGVRHAVGVASGTDALLLAIRALDLEPDDEVVVPAFTFFATAGAIWNAGLRPVFCDVDPETFNVTAGTVEAAWTDRSRAVVPVDLFGQMAPLEEVAAVARRHGAAAVVEDAAQALGAWRRSAEGEGRTMAGAGATVGALSFFPTKNLGGFGDGGMVTSDDDALSERIRKLRVHGGRQMYHHEMVGTNSRLDALQAAVLRTKLPHLDDWGSARRRNADLYDDLLRDVAEVRTPFRDPSCHHVFNQYTIQAERRDELRAFLVEQGIGTGVYYPVPLHVQPCFRALGYRPGDLPISEVLATRVLSLPVFPELDAARIRRVTDAVKAFYAGGW